MSSVLFSPGVIGGLESRNRIVLPSMTTRLATGEGHVTDATVAYYEARARGGVGVVTVEMAAPERAGRHRFHELGLYDDRFLPGLARLVGPLTGAGAQTCIQLGHGGGHTRRDICGETPIAPSAIPHSVFEVRNETIVPEAMSKARIEETTAAYVAAARRAREAGFDCVEVHAAHGYLISQFLCPAENLRDDDYGGTLANRARFGLDILRRIKHEVADLPVIFRFNGDDFMPDGMTGDEALRLARWAEEAGADALHVTGGHYRSTPHRAIMIPPMDLPEATFLDLAARIKADAGVPVIAVGRLGDPAIAEAAVADGKADFVALGRTLLADPEWPEKVRAGRAVRRCIACNTCVNDMRGGASLGCLVNPAAGRELEFRDAAPPAGERIAVVGAGPAGLSYVYLAADGAGNRITVFEKADRAGGSFRYAGHAPKFQEVDARPGPLMRFIADLEAGCREKDVAFRFEADPVADPALLDGFDHVVIAAGARYRFGLGPLVRTLLAEGRTLPGPLARLFTVPKLRDWFYYRARRATGEVLRRRLEAPGRRITVIGDAAAPGKAKTAIAAAIAAALKGTPETSDRRAA